MNFTSDQRLLSTFLVVLVVASLAIPFVTMGATAAGSDYSKTWTGADDVRFVGFSTEGWTADNFQIQVTANDAPGGTPDVIYRENHTLAELQNSNNAVVFENAGAYSNITMTVKNAENQPDFRVGSDWGVINFDNDMRLGSTGGDRDLVCDTAESLASATNPAVNIVDCNVPPDETNVDTTDLDTNETKLEIYQSGATQADSADNYQTLLSNHLQDTETVALTKGKGAYIRSLNDGAGETAAKSSATENITEYYSTTEYNLISEWNSQASNVEYLDNLVLAESGIPESFVNGTHDGIDSTSMEFAQRPFIKSVGTTQYTLQNGSNVDAKTITIATQAYYPSDGTYYWSNTTISPTTGDWMTDFNGWRDMEPAMQTNITGIRIGAPTSNYEDLKPMDFSEYKTRLSTIDSQTTSANDQMSTVVNQTYSEYTAGEINSSDLVDPYVLQNQFSPGDEYQSWSASQLALLGTNQPTDLSTTGYMNITLEDGTTLTGILQSRENPASGEFVVNETYNPDDIGGSQWITTDTQTREITQNFTLDTATTSDGATRDNVTIVKKNYTTTSSDDLVTMQEQLSKLRTDLETREQNTAGGGALLAGTDSTTLFVIAGVIGLLLIARDGKDGGNY